MLGVRPPRVLKKKTKKKKKEKEKKKKKKGRKSYVSRISNMVLNVNRNHKAY